MCPPPLPWIDTALLCKLVHCHNFWKEFKNLQQKLVVAHHTLFLIPGSFLGPISEETPCLCPECLPPPCPHWLTLPLWWGNWLLSDRRHFSKYFYKLFIRDQWRAACVGMIRQQLFFRVNFRQLFFAISHRQLYEYTLSEITSFVYLRLSRKTKRTAACCHHYSCVSEVLGQN